MNQDGESTLLGSKLFRITGLYNKASPEANRIEINGTCFQNYMLNIGAVNL